MLNKNGERELAYVATITDKKSIEGYDRICIYYVNGWTCVGGKDEFEIGDKCVFIEPDAFCPYTDTFKFLDESIDEHTGKKRADRHKIKVQKFCKGQAISSGLIIPLKTAGLKDTLEVGDFLTKKLGIIYWEKEDNTRKANNSKFTSMQARHKKFFKTKLGKWLMRREWGRKLCFLFLGKKRDKKTDWPSWVIRTDEERCLGANTRIDTDQGLLRIADIVMKRLPVKVKSYNAKDNKIEYKSIIDYQHYNKELGYFEIKVPFSIGALTRNKTIRCTPDHKFYVGNGIYKKASELSIHDTVYTSEYTYKENEILEFIYGNILGDGHLYKENNLIRFSFGQGDSHKDYVDTLFSAYNGGHYLSEKNGFNKDKTNYRFGLINTALLTKDINECKIFTGKKWFVNESFCNRLTWKSLATWYMDDGSMHRGTSAPSAVLHTEGYSHEEQLVLIRALQNNFNLNSNINRGSKGYEYIRITCGSSKIFFENVAPYIIPSMQYKLPEYLRKSQNYLGKLRYSFDHILLPTKIKSIKYVSRYMESYDIEVQDNHNFFAGGLLTHNCQNLPQLFTNNSKEYIATEKIDGTSTTFTMKQARPKKREMLVCSRNVVFDTLEKEERNFYKDTDGNVYLEMAGKYEINKVLCYILDKHPEYEFITIQGETYGGSIQKRNYGPEHRLAIFNYIFKKNGKAPIRLNPIQMKEEIDSINKAIGTRLETVPIILDKFKLPDTCDELLKIAEGNSVIDGQPREGIVFRDNKGEESFKAVSNSFLLKYHNG